MFTLGEFLFGFGVTAALATKATIKNVLFHQSKTYKFEMVCLNNQFKTSKFHHGQSLNYYTDYIMG